MSKSDRRPDDTSSHQPTGTSTLGSSPISSLSLPSGPRIQKFRRSAKGFGSTGRDDELRRRYLYRLGINEKSCGSDVHSDHDSISTTFSRGSSSSNPLIMYDICQSSESSRSSRTKSRRSRSSSTVDKVLLRKSVQYTTELKFDKSDPTDIATTTLRNFTAQPSPPRSDELSTAWANILGIGDDDSQDTKGGETEPLDGAFDLFSLPSDSSLVSYKRAVTAAATSTDSVSEASSYNSHTLASSFSFKSMDRAIGEINHANSMSLSEHSTLSNRRKVSFDSTVRATTIPPRQSYSQRVRTKLWSSSEDILNNAIRNEFEFQYDGHDWRRIREESDFIPLDPSSDEKIHPAHFYGMHGSSRSMPALHTQESSTFLERNSSSSDDDDGSDMHFCGVFGMELNDA
jgi:hypothetical protein